MNPICSLSDWEKIQSRCFQHLEILVKASSYRKLFTFLFQIDIVLLYSKWLFLRYSDALLEEYRNNKIDDIDISICTIQEMIMFVPVCFCIALKSLSDHEFGNIYGQLWNSVTVPFIKIFEIEHFPFQTQDLAKWETTILQQLDWKICFFVVHDANEWISIQLCETCKFDLHTIHYGDEISGVCEACESLFFEMEKKWYEPILKAIELQEWNFSQRFVEIIG